MGKYLEPTQAPRGAELSSIEARKRIHANARLATYRVPLFNDNVTGHRQIVDQNRKKPLSPYTSQIAEGLIMLVDESAENNGGIK